MLGFSLHVLRIFAAIVIREISLYFYFFVGSLHVLGIKVTMTSQNELDNVLSVSVLWNNFRRIDVNSSV